MHEGPAGVDPQPHPVVIAARQFDVRHERPVDAVLQLYHVDIHRTAGYVEGMDIEEGEKLLQELLEWTTRTRFVLRHEWTPGDTLIWDNTGVLHRVEPYPLDSGRIMDRSTVLGEEAFG